MSFDAHPEAFIEDALSDFDALAACDRYLVRFDLEGILIRLCAVPDARRVNLVSKDQALTLVTKKMDAGLEVWVEG